MALFNWIFTPLALAFVYRTISTVVRNKLRATLTVLDDIPGLGIPRKAGLKVNGTAVVCGGSIAGLISARVCADHFENVVMIEPEVWVTTAEGLDDHHRDEQSTQKRSRVPQYATFHGFQSMTTLALRKLFTTFELEVCKAGARFVPADAKMHWSGVPIKAPWHQYTVDNVPTVATLTRAGYETVIRRTVLSTCSNVKYIPGAVTGLIRSESSAETIDSVRIRSHDGEESTLPAALVVDCTGPALGGLRWLQNIASASSTGTQKQKSSLPLDALKVTYDPKMAYSTCEFDVPRRLIPSLKALGLPGDFETAGFLYVNFANPRMDSRNLIIGRKENNFRAGNPFHHHVPITDGKIVQFACGGWDVRERMASIDDIRNFLSQMILLRPIPQWVPRMLDLFEEERVRSTYVHARCPPSVYVQYHLAENIPSNFIALGDSVLQLNPIRGQGCTKACVDAITLNGLLTKCAATSTSSGKRTGNLLPQEFSRTFFRLQRKRTGALWEKYKSDDYGWKTTTPSKGDDLRRTKAWERVYGAAISRLVIKDRDVAAVWWHTSNWLAPSTDLFAPIIILKLAWMQLEGFFGL